VLSARRIVGELLEEAILLPVQRWNFRHLIERYAERLEKIPMLERPDHARAVEGMFVRFRLNTKPITVGDAAWWMPFPMGWRLIGENDQVKSILDPTQTITVERVENPLLSSSDQTYWRGKN
jgi:hypothetical protein